MSRNMLGLVALDFVLRIALRGVMHVPLVVEISHVNRDDLPGDPSRLRVPAHVVADLKPARHRASRKVSSASSRSQHSVRETEPPACNAPRYWSSRQGAFRKKLTPPRQPWS